MYGGVSWAHLLVILLQFEPIRLFGSRTRVTTTKKIIYAYKYIGVRQVHDTGEANADVSLWGFSCGK